MVTRRKHGATKEAPGARLEGLQQRKETVDDSTRTPDQRFPHLSIGNEEGQPLARRQRNVSHACLPVSTSAAPASTAREAGGATNEKSGRRR